MEGEFQDQGQLDQDLEEWLSLRGSQSVHGFFSEEKKWYLLLHQSIFPLDCVKSHVQNLLKGSEADQYVVQNLTWSGVDLRSTLSNTLLQKLLTLVPLTATGPEVYVAIMNTFISNYYDDLEETLTHMKSLKLKRYPGDNITYCCAAILIPLVP